MSGSLSVIWSGSGGVPCLTLGSTVLVLVMGLPWSLHWLHLGQEQCSSSTAWAATSLLPAVWLCPVFYIVQYIQLVQYLSIAKYAALQPAALLVLVSLYTAQLQCNDTRTRTTRGQM